MCVVFRLFSWRVTFFLTVLRPQRLGVLKFSHKKKKEDGHDDYFDCITRAIDMVCENRVEATDA